MACRSYSSPSRHSTVSTTLILAFSAWPRFACKAASTTGTASTGVSFTGAGAYEPAYELTVTPPFNLASSVSSHCIYDRIYLCYEPRKGVIITAT
ncbi:hypothetical protein BN14_01167 [Rhizoctonia solani AG-1 IB]|uniref:Uncharacterized protein n=1 Tax=Thanatephorus cucumeris (strain AG1-IB / isolate 7/3/14) TaxID=1108050 RepID=M5BTS7_THACB|nr:hypothetical protein BN14_01167 [Rhizoctonia solani AG-1 IB]